jgi:hypothetical protein
MSPISSYEVRLARLEKAARRSRLVSWILGTAFVFTLFFAARAPVQRSDVVRTKLLVIEDSTGQERIVLGAPMPDGRGYAGMKILDPSGQEQFGLGLKRDGSVSMGFDIKPGVGNPANRERLNMGVSSTGHGWIRFLDNDTKAKVFLQVDGSETGVLQFLNWTADNRILVKEQSFNGQKEFEWK